MSAARTILIVMACATACACKPPKLPDEVAAKSKAPPITQDQAHQAFEATKAAWLSMDAARIRALYAKDVAGFDVTGPLISHSETWDARKGGYAEARIDKAKFLTKKVQLLDDDAFIVSTLARTSSTAEPGADGTLRCTDVYRRNADGRILIVNEHCSRLQGS